MRYNSLDDLIQNSRSSRAYFLSLPINIQMYLHKNSGHITTAQKLHFYASYAESDMKSDSIAGINSLQ